MMGSRRVSVISAASMDSIEGEAAAYRASIDGGLGPDLVAHLEERRRAAEAEQKRVLLEPVIALYFAAWVPTLSLTQQYIYWRVARDMNLTEDPNHVYVEQRPCRGQNLTGSQLEKLHNVQEEVADWLVYLDLSGDIPGLFMVMFLGTYANIIGRRQALLLPPLGGLVTCITYIAHALFSLPMEVLFVGSVVEALSGGYTGMLIGCLYYMEDTLDRGQDPVVFALSDISYGVVLGLAEVGMGYFMKHAGFVIPLVVLLVINVLNIVYIAYFVPDIKKNSAEGFKPSCCSCDTFYRPRLGHLKLMLALLIFTLMIFTMAYAAKPALFTLYQLNVPFCWDSVEIGHFRGISFAISQITQTIFTLFLIKPLTSIGVFILSCLSLMAQFIWMSFTTTDLAMYLAPLFGFAGAVSSPLVITVLYNLVPPSEQDSLLADIFVLDIVCNILGATILNLIYGLSPTSFKGIVFLIMSGFMLIAIILISVFAVVKRKHKKLMLQIELTEEPEKPDHEMSRRDYMIMSTRL